MKMQIKPAVVSLGILFSIVCEANSGMNWEGKWYNSEINWGMELKNEKYFEWERGYIQREANYKIMNDGDGYNIVIITKEEEVTFSLRIIDDNNIQIQFESDWYDLSKK
ncbi:hypothetical protein ACMXYV_08105 [Neptuniibacter sp. SY11_33]|uniref:hypothetical protein n=1 Tax=Neptuniibacter sp. SY11_33 TaxID=3398215 RepID=UPI0039F5F9BA